MDRVFGLPAGGAAVVLYIGQALPVFARSDIGEALGPDEMECWARAWIEGSLRNQQPADLSDLTAHIRRREQAAAAIRFPGGRRVLKPAW